MIRDFPGNYSQYRETTVYSQQSTDKDTSIFKEAVVVEKINIEKKRQLTFKEKREFETLGKEIADLNMEKASITEKLNSGSTPFEELQKLALRIGEVTQMLDEKEFRWLELSELI